MYSLLCLREEQLHNLCVCTACVYSVCVGMLSFLIWLSHLMWAVCKSFKSSSVKGLVGLKNASPMRGHGRPLGVACDAPLSFDLVLRIEITMEWKPQLNKRLLESY